MFNTFQKSDKEHQLCRIETTIARQPQPQEFIKKEFLKINKLKTLKNFMTPFYSWGSTVSRLQNLWEETVYFLPLISQGVLVFI